MSNQNLQFQSTKEKEFYNRTEQIFKNSQFYIKYQGNVNVKSQEIKSIDDAKAYLIHRFGKNRYDKYINKKTIATSHSLLVDMGFEVKDRNRFSENFDKRSKQKEKTEDDQVYVSLGKFFLVYEEGPYKGKPVKINGERIESDTKGEMIRFIHSSIALKDAQQPNMLSSNGIKERLFSVKRDVFEVEKGYHSRIL